VRTGASLRGRFHPKRTAARPPDSVNLPLLPIHHGVRPVLEISPPTRSSRKIGWSSAIGIRISSLFVIGWRSLVVPCVPVAESRRAPLRRPRGCGQSAPVQVTTVHDDGVDLRRIANVLRRVGVEQDKVARFPLRPFLPSRTVRRTSQDSRSRPVVPVPVSAPIRRAARARREDRIPESRTDSNDRSPPGCLPPLAAPAPRVTFRFEPSPAASSTRRSETSRRPSPCEASNPVSMDRRFNRQSSAVFGSSRIE
jgi:hypothetical protein